MISPRGFLGLVIARWEGEWQDDPADQGNWVKGRLIGTMRGVTPAAWAAYRGMDPEAVTVEQMKAITLEDAADIGMKFYYEGPRFDLLAWGPATAAVVDFGWGSGPGQAVKSMQRIVGTNPDGGLGPITAKAYNEWIEREGRERATERIRQMRRDFYNMICERNSTNLKFLRGWLNRSDWASSQNPQFAGLWA